MTTVNPDAAVTADPLVLPPAVAAELSALDRAALADEAAIAGAFVDEHFAGDLAPREAHRIRGELASLLELVQRQHQRAGAGTGANAVTDAQSVFETLLRSFEVDIDLLVAGAASAVARSLDAKK